MNQNNNEQQNQEMQQSPEPQYILVQNGMPQGAQPQFQQQDDEIDLKELWNVIWAGKWLIVGITFLFSVASIVYAINQPNIYKATTVLAPEGDSGGGSLGKLAGQFGGLASLAGISLGGGSVDKTGIALEILKSRVFTEAFIEKHQLIVPLIAAKDWDQKNNQLIFDEKLYNSQSNEWVREVSFPKTVKPSPWEAFEAFKEIVSISQDKETGMVSISIEHYSPEFAKKWLVLLVKDINEEMRSNDQDDAQSSIDFLNEKLQSNQLASDMQSVFYQLIEEQTKTLMLTEVSKEYVLKTIEPANAPDTKDSPKRALFCVLGVLLGGMLSVAIVLIKNVFRKDK